MRIFGIHYKKDTHMSLISCKECHGLVSTEATFCPHCGYPVSLSAEPTIAEPEPVKEPEPVAAPEPVAVPEPVAAPEPVKEPEPAKPQPEPAKPEPEPEPQPAKVIAPEVCPEPHLVKAIIFTVLFFMPFGIPAIVNAAKVRPAFNRGNMDLAKRCSRKANRWCTWSLVLGIIMWVAFTVLMVSFFEVLIDSI